MITTRTRLGLHVTDLTVDVQDGPHTRRLLDSVSVDVAPGEVLGISGPSGSGKSTLLSVVGCLQPATAGTAELITGSGRLTLTHTHGSRAAAIRREHIGIMFQSPNLLPALTVQQQLQLMPRLGRILPLPARQRAEATARATQLLEAVGLGGFEHRRISELSGGQQARVNLARALMNSPELLLVDEPTAALDQRTAATITDLIRDMAQKFGAAAMFVSHDAKQLAQLDQVVELVDGKLAVG